LAYFLVEGVSLKLILKNYLSNSSYFLSRGSSLSVAGRGASFLTDFLGANNYLFYSLKLNKKNFLSNSS
jgi:hypothetical protein